MKLSFKKIYISTFSRLKKAFSLRRFTVILLILTASPFVLCAPPVRYHNPGDYFEFTVPIIPQDGEILDLSVFRRPIAADSFVTIKDGHFYANGERVNFLGTNLAFAGAFPVTAGEARLLSRKIAKYGINLVRMHSLDATDGRPSLIDSADETTQKLDLQNFDRLDRLVFELKEKGVYVNLNLHINRYFRPGDGVEEAELLTNFSKGANLFNRRMIELQKDYARAVLTHVNPYTQNPYTDEPAVAFVEITNENSFFYSFYSGRIDSLPPHYLAELSDLFTGYLKEQYKETSNLEKAWESKSRGLQGLKEGESLDGVVKIPLRSERRTPKVWEDYMAFLQKTEEAYFREMYSFLKDELGVTAPVTGTMAFGLGGLASQKHMDFIDIHSYMNHPYYTEGDWQGEWFIENTPLVNQLEGQPLQWAAVHRLKDKPFVMSEFNTPYPNWYEADSLPLFSTFAKRSDWDGLYIFDFNASGNYMSEKVTTFFDIDAHPVKMAQLIIAHNILVRGDVPDAKEEILAAVPEEKAVATMVDLSWNNTHLALGRLGLKELPSFDRTFAFEFTDKDKLSYEVKAPKKNPSPVQVAGERGRNYITLDTPRTKFGTGFIAGKEIALDGLRFTAQNLQSLYSAVCFTSLDEEENSIFDSAKTLIVVGGRTENTFSMWNKDFTNATFGMDPVTTEGIKVEVALEHQAEKLYVYALDTHSAIKKELQVERDGPLKGGGYEYRFTLDPEHKTIWYLVSAQEF